MFVAKISEGGLTGSLVTWDLRWSAVGIHYGSCKSGRGSACPGGGVVAAECGGAALVRGC